MPFRYPISLELEGKPCVVIGGGDMGEEKARGLLDAGAAVTVISESFTDGLEQLARSGELELVRKAYSDGDLQGASVAIAATGESEINALAFEEAKRRGVLLNAVDDIPHCHYAVPSIVRRGDFLLTISTGGKAPALSKKLRKQLAREFGPEYGVLVEVLGAVREKALPRRTVDFQTWARRWRKALDHELLTLVRQGRLLEARDLVRSVVEDGRGQGGANEPRPAKVYIVGAGPGDPELITVRGRRLLDEADVVIYDRLVHSALVEGKEAIYAGKTPGHSQLAQEQTNAMLVKLAAEGKTVVRLKGGDPFVFGRGGEEAEALCAAGIAFEIVPAPSSATAGPAYAGIPVTHRDHASSVAFVTGHSASDGMNWRALANSVDTLVILMGLANLDEITKELIAGGRAPETPSALIEDATLPSQRVIVGSLQDLAGLAAESNIKQPALIVIGQVVNLREKIDWFKQAQTSADVPGSVY